MIEEFDKWNDVDAIDDLIQQVNEINKIDTTSDITKKVLNTAYHLNKFTDDKGERCYT